MMLQETLDLIQEIVIKSSATLSLGGSFLLFLRGRKRRTHLILACLMLFFGLQLLFRSAIVTFNLPLLYHQMNDSVLGPRIIIFSNFCVIIASFYPIEVVRSGWLNVKRIFLLLSPQIMLTAIYFTVLLATGEKIEDIASFPELSRHIGSFNVWFRFLFLIYGAFYLVYFLSMFSKYYVSYRKILEDYNVVDNFESFPCLNYFISAVIVIYFFYHVALFTAGPFTMILFYLSLIISMLLLLYYVLFHSCPCPEDLTDCLTQIRSVQKGESPESSCGPEESLEDFSQNPIAHYQSVFESWMEEEKPYLYKDFKLLDVSRVLPLNRSYLSRFFNEGYGMSFSRLVRRYRLKYAKDLLLEQPEIPVYQVADRSGFSSSSTFIHVFTEEEKMTPGEFRENHKH